MKIIFAGTPDFAVPCLQALLDSSHEVLAVYTQPDRPAGRGRVLTASPIKALALEHGVPVMQPRSLKDLEAQSALSAYQADLMIVVAYGLILPKAVLTIPRLGCVNVHASLLPRWRGAAPIQRAILAGDAETGITIMKMDEGLDTGDSLFQLPCLIDVKESAESLHNRLSLLGAEALLSTLDDIASNSAIAMPQDESQATYAPKLTKAEARLNWHASAEELVLAVRAFNPWPVAFVEYESKNMRVWSAEVVAEVSDKQPGTLIRAESSGIDVATGDGVLRLLTVQLPGGRALQAKDFVNAHREKLSPGQVIFK